MKLQDYEKNIEAKPEKTVLRIVMIAIGIMCIVGALMYFLGIVGNFGGVVTRVTNPDHIISSYEEFEEMYSTCNKVCDDLRVLNNNEVDPKGFSKAERNIALENNLNRWIREYNAKSREITRNMWKSSQLPYQLSREDFSCK